MNPTRTRTARTHFVHLILSENIFFRSKNEDYAKVICVVVPNAKKNPVVVV